MRGYVNFWPGNKKFRAYINASDPEKFDDTCIGYFEKESDAWSAVLNYFPKDYLYMPGRNKHRVDIDRLEIGQVRFGFLVAGKRRVHDGMLSSHHFDFYLIKIAPEIGKRNELWISERSFQDFIFAVDRPKANRYSCCNETETKERNRCSHNPPI